MLDGVVVSDKIVVSALTNEPGGNMLTRPESAERVGVSVSQWRRNFDNKLIVPVRDPSGRYLYHEDQVNQLRDQFAQMKKRHEEPVAVCAIDRTTYAAMLADFDAGKDPVTVAREHGMYLHETEPVFLDFVRNRGRVVLEKEHLERMQKSLRTRHGYGDELASGPQMVTVIEMLVDHASVEDGHRACRACKFQERRAVWCAPCAAKQFGGKKG